MMFFFNDTATTEIYTLSLHDALPISQLAEDFNLSMQGSGGPLFRYFPWSQEFFGIGRRRLANEIGRAHRLNSSHANISYAVFCLKKKDFLALDAKMELTYIIPPIIKN